MDHNTILAALMLRNRDSGTSGLPSGSSPNQYLVTDVDGNAKWEDKLAWSETAVGELLAETSFTFETDDGYTEFEMPALTIGKKYTVKLNGVVYDLECFNDNGAPTIGAPYYDWSSYSFSICIYEGAAILAVQKAGTYTVSVSGEFETIHKLSGQYVEGMGWSETHLQPLVENLTYTTEEFNDCAIYRDNGNNVTFEPNTQYKVEYDGEVYTCTTRPIYDCYEPGTQDVLGNTGLSQHHVDGGAVDSGEPFCIQPHSGGWWVGTRTPGKHTFSIWKETETIHPVDKKYLPRQDWYYYSTPDCVLYKDVNLTDAVTIADMEDVLSCGKFREVYDGEVGGDIRFAGGAFFNPGKTKGFKVSSVSAHSDGTVNVLELKSSDYKAAGPI